ncbi:MAG TPA: tRNA guanosine(34) transglycosylase Tgt, partial [Pirellulales bacterium]
CPQLPAHKPRYLMGVGTPIDLLEGIVRGVDMFDCVMPTRNGRNALVFTDAGPVRLRNTQWKEDPNPLEANCPCPACRHSKAYLRHLFQADEMTGPILASLHNLHYYQRITREAREAIRAGRYAEFRAAKIAGWGGAKAVEEASEG